MLLLHPRLRNVPQAATAPVVQLNRMSDSGSEDRGFESRRGYDSHPFGWDFLFDFVDLTIDFFQNYVPDF